MSTTPINTPGSMDSTQSESGTWDPILTQEYSSACNDILDPKQGQLTFARETFPRDLFIALGEEYFLSNLEIEDIEAAGEDFFHHPNVTAERVQLIFSNISNKEIEKKGFVKLATMSISEIILGKKVYDELGLEWQTYLSKISYDKVRHIEKAMSKSKENLMAIGVENLMEEGMDLSKISTLCNIQKPLAIGDFTMIVREYTPDEIKELGARLVTMPFAQIVLFPEQYDTLIGIGMKPDSMDKIILLMISKNFTPADIIKVGRSELCGMVQQDFRARKKELLKEGFLESSKTPKS
ncbi:hypothetical protein A9Q91_00385 [Candidatus Gracilibacteria bacterium 28_42_T64]|nr:hypothetical protein A9Q91_00385 [Candidatus Gracilibacteria bacterium 28_42_T64]